MYHRNLEKRVRDALRRSPVVMLNGARQVGKSTLARSLVDDGVMRAYLTLDDFATLEAASSDPEGFVSGLSSPTVIDEVQLEPRLFRAIKAAVDRDRSPGRFLLTGSADLTVMPHASEALVGRLEVLTLWPLSMGERSGDQDGFVDAAFTSTDGWQPDDGFNRAELIHSICIGGFPEAVDRDARDRTPWHRSYVDLVIRRDVAERTDIAGLASMPRLFALLSARTTTLVSMAEIGRSMGIPATTLRRYVALLEAAMLIRPIPAFSGDLAKRMVKSPKLAVIDTGLAAALGGLDPVGIAADPIQLGRLAETFVVNEIQKQLGWSEVSARIMHTRTVAGREIDAVLQSNDGRVVGIEVKAGASVGANDFAGLRALRSAVGDRFVQGLVLNTGGSVVPFGDRLFAAPVSVLWRPPSDPRSMEDR